MYVCMWVSECVVWHTTRHIRGHFGDESFQAIDCTDSDNQKQGNKETKHQIHPKHKKETEKIALANNTNYILVWYAFCDLLPGNGVGPFSQLQSPHGGEWVIWHLTRVDT